MVKYQEEKDCGLGLRPFGLEPKPSNVATDSSGAPSESAPQDSKADNRKEGCRPHPRARAFKRKQVTNTRVGTLMENKVIILGIRNVIR